MKRNLLVFLLFAAMCVCSASAQDSSERKSSGVCSGVIERAVLDKNGLFSLWLRIQGKMHEFVVTGAEVIGGEKSDLGKGKSVRIRYRNLEHSEMDDFYTADAREVTILQQENNKAVGKGLRK
ncbi:MAG: hypothetical protein C0402_01935 [Thermodesulfovibrio sp.]|nr:hypothetical protein [Thermodesulfovibrio sp.]